MSNDILDQVGNEVFEFYSREGERKLNGDPSVRRKKEEELLSTNSNICFLSHAHLPHFFPRLTSQIFKS